MDLEQARFLDPIEGNMQPCWDARHCPDDWRKNCTAWEYEAGFACWEVTGTYCQGQQRKTRLEKYQMCRSCEVFQSTLLQPNKQ